MTQSIETLAREIAISIVRDDASEAGIVAFARLMAYAVRLGIEAGIKLGREQAAEIADNGGYLNLDFPYDRARQHIAQAIRALP